MCLSPLTGTNNVTLLKKISANQIIKDWLEIYQLDIADEFRGYHEIFLYRCNETKLKFFLPEDIVGSGSLYEKLEKFDWYYMPFKWEHRIAAQDIKKGDRVIEIGCGYGEFLEGLGAAQIEAYGIELNSKAVEKAQKLGRPVNLMSLEEVVKQQSKAYDAVCIFQVLEHIPNPSRFINLCIDLLKPGGRLLICVPDSDGFIRLADKNLLNQPPHHISLWSKHVLKALPKYFSLKVTRMLSEPLALYHLDWFTNLYLKRMPQIWPLTRLINRIVRNCLLPILRVSKLYKLFRGHSIYVCYQKINRLP